MLLLRGLLGEPLGSRGTAHVLGDPALGLQWHVFMAALGDDASAAAQGGVPARTGSALSGDSLQSSSSDVAFNDECEPVLAAFNMRANSMATPLPGADAPALATLEVCMTELSEAAAAQFVRGEAFISSTHTTEASGIRALAPGAKIDDYLFEPCGCASVGAKRSMACLPGSAWLCMLHMLLQSRCHHLTEPVRPSKQLHKA